jgi:glucose/arabinose dehydrogenase
MQRKVFWTVVWVCLMLVTTAADFTHLPASEGQSQPAAPVVWPALTLEQVNLLGLVSPVYLTHAGDGSGRMFIVERAGRIRLVKNGNLQTTPFLDISGLVLSPANGGGGEDGMMNVAFPPDYAQRQRFYVYYTNLNGDLILARFRTSPDPDLADPTSKEEILNIPHPTFSNHNGGQLAFGPDGYLYLAPGDGGGSGDPNNNAQNPATLLGKVLRIDVEAKIPFTPPSEPYQIYLPVVARNPGLAYRIPPDNPFVNQTGYRPEIWALGLRNPWRFSFDHQTQDLYIADVGQDTVEEIDFQAAGSSGGANYGWNILEGSLCYSPATGCVPPPGYVAPVYEYLHGANDSNGCSITGGYVYRGTASPDLQGIYFYADFCRAKIWGLKFENSTWQSSLLLQEPAYEYTFSSFGEDESGEVYLVRLSGQVYRLTGAFPAR